MSMRRKWFVVISHVFIIINKTGTVLHLHTGSLNGQQNVMQDVNQEVNLHHVIRAISISIHVVKISLVIVTMLNILLYKPRRPKVCFNFKST